MPPRRILRQQCAARVFAQLFAVRCSSAAAHSHSLNESACDSVYGSAPPVPASVFALKVFFRVLQRRRNNEFVPGAGERYIQDAHFFADGLTLRCAIRTARWGTVE